MTDRPTPGPLRTLVTGAGGQLGRELARSLSRLGDVTAHDRAALDVTDADALRAAVRAARPDVVVNAAAYTAVDRAEAEPDLAHAINAVAPGVLAQAAAEAGALLVHYSTDYVFDGTATAPIPESAPTHPLGVYGRTKRDGERAVEAVGGRAVVLRTSWVYAAHGHNFLRTMRRLGDERDALAVVDDQRGTPTSAVWLADATADVVTAALRDGLDRPDLVHATCAGETTWFGFAEAIFERWPPTTPLRLDPIPTSAYPTPAARPAYSVLDTGRLGARYGVRPPHWAEALDALAAAAPGP